MQTFALVLNLGRGVGWTDAIIFPFCWSLFHMWTRRGSQFSFSPSITAPVSSGTRVAVGAHIFSFLFSLLDQRSFWR